MSQPLNVLWISTHDINPHLGAYAGAWPGAERATTPNLDRLAAEGMRFDQAFATAPVCAPSRSSILTGRHPISIGTMHMRTKAVPPPEVRLLPEIFREAGYYTVNNWFTDFQMDVPPTAFDELSMQAHWRNRAEGQPFFAMFHGLATHESSIYADDEQYAALTAAVPDSARVSPDDVELPPYYPDTEVFRKSWARYLELITATDAWVGNILDELEQDGLADSTIVVFWSDHGLGMPRGKRWLTEAGLREPLIVRWPGVVAAGSSTDEIVSLMDLAPTMLTICGLPVPDHMQGKPIFDAAGALEAPNEYVFSSRDRMDEQEDTSRSVRDRRFRLVKHLHPDRSGMQHHTYADGYATWAEMRRLAFEESEQLARGLPKSLLSPLQRFVMASTKPAIELYDIPADPFEERNLAADPAYAGVVARLETALSSWQDECGDLGILDETQLIEMWRPGGLRPKVAEVRVHPRDDGSFVATCETEGARIGWLDRAPSQRSAQPLWQMFGPMALTFGVEAESAGWRPVTGPLTTASRVYLKAWRPGFEPSDEVVIEP